MCCWYSLNKILCMASVWNVCILWTACQCISCIYLFIYLSASVMNLINLHDVFARKPAILAWYKSLLLAVLYLVLVALTYKVLCIASVWNVCILLTACQWISCKYLCLFKHEWKKMDQPNVWLILRFFVSCFVSCAVSTRLRGFMQSFVLKCFQAMNSLSV